MEQRKEKKKTKNYTRCRKNEEQCEGNDWKKWGYNVHSKSSGQYSRVALKLELLIALHLYERSAPSWAYNFNLVFRDDFFFSPRFLLPLSSVRDLFSRVTISFVGFETEETGSCSHEPRIHLQLARLWTQKLWVNCDFVFFSF